MVSDEPVCHHYSFDALCTLCAQELPQLQEPTEDAEAGPAVDVASEQQPQEDEGEAIQDEFDLADLMSEETGSTTQSNADRLAEIDAQIKVRTETCCCISHSKACAQPRACHAGKVL